MLKYKTSYMKDKIIYCPLIFLAILALYLYTANAFIYFRIGHGNLITPVRQDSYTMSNDKNTITKIYTALGDSLTAGVGADKYEESYPYLLASRMKNDGTNIVLNNFSVPGAQTKDLISDYLNSAIATQPDVITLFIGVNDVHNHVGRAQFEKNYTYILERLTKETKAKIYLINIPLIGSHTTILPPLDYYFEKETDSYNEVIAKLAAKYQLQDIDLNTPTKELFRFDGTHYSADSFHPSAAGYQLWADIIYDSFNK